ncbi:MAG: helix-turn-helix domain-containing protein [Candidatus Dormibacteria bacterium]
MRELMVQEGISQSELAHRARVNQSTVSRALSRTPVRHSVAYERLCRYMQEARYLPQLSAGEEVVVKAFRQIWDGSDAHAEAVAKIIAASRGLGPRSGSKPH